MDRAVAEAARELLAERGYAGLTVDAVAARAGVGKAAIYRRYATRQEMIFAAVVHGLDLETPADTGSFRGDLGALLGDIAARLVAPPPGVVPGLFADLHADPALAARFTGSFVATERRCVSDVLDRAVARGELPSRPDPAVAHALLIGPVFAWLFLLAEDHDRLDGLVRAAAEAAAVALGASPLGTSP
ncbi:TetR/AcrR family transcriptional regulator [Nonomuraea roseoviolacea]|uniref:AcrR family transcriptional regulator n=1 Tax=Nonomuraea roseoviolacea subsp. carminata TaxID=160689 RepID=A0ABT1JVW3_9ACTN|nr:TetR/AcrR family transcriptional regulator [Nonomuraea roseoviolacea]MCP2345537.1 AcrR family transcriptional regulator [Nonomuraea roseoviolacea subsp. carminata]